jgi:hypothetical protein
VPEPFYLDDGSQAGWLHTTATGEFVLADEDGAVFAVVDGDGNQLDPEEFEAPPAEAEKSEVAHPELDARLHAVEERLANPEPIYPAVAPQPDFEASAADLATQLRAIGRMRGAEVTRDEQLPILQRIREDIDAGREVDVYDAIARVEAENGRALADVDTDEGRQQWWVQRLQDGEAEQRGDELGQVAPESRSEYDLDDDRSRQDYMIDRMRGALSGPEDLPEYDEEEWSEEAET